MTFFNNIEELQISRNDRRSIFPLPAAARRAAAAQAMQREIARAAVREVLG